MMLCLEYVPQFSFPLENTSHNHIRLGQNLVLPALQMHSNPVGPLILELLQSEV